jgi:hypothetical protein
MFATPNDTCGLVTTGLTALVALAFVVFQVQQKQWAGVGTFVVVLALLAACCRFGVCRCVGDLRVCLLLAVLAANVVALPQRASADATDAAETFANPEGAAAATATDASTGADAAAAAAPAAKPAVDAPAPKAATTAPAAPAAADDPDDDDDKEPNYVDTFSTFMETYKSLTPGQIETMTSDTKDLIATQKSLMETVKSLAPVITQGREMMDTFKDYFGPNSHKDLMKAFKGGSGAAGGSDKAQA